MPVVSAAAFGILSCSIKCSATRQIELTIILMLLYHQSLLLSQLKTFMSSDVEVASVNIIN